MSGGSLRSVKCVLILSGSEGRVVVAPSNNARDQFHPLPNISTGAVVDRSSVSDLTRLIEKSVLPWADNRVGKLWVPTAIGRSRRVARIAHDTGHSKVVSAAQTHPSGTTSTIAVRSAYASSIRQMAVSTSPRAVTAVEADRLNVYGNPAQFINSMKT